MCWKDGQSVGTNAYLSHTVSHPNPSHFSTATTISTSSYLQPMLRRSVRSVLRAQCRNQSTSHRPQQVPQLPDASLETFRKHAFEPAIPALFPRRHFVDLPAVSKWFSKSPKHGYTVLNTTYLSKYGATIVPLEIANDGHFARVEQSLSFFLECVKASMSRYRKRDNRYFSAYVPNARAVMKRNNNSNDFFTSTPNIAKPTARIYLAQASLDDFPKALAEDVPTPESVLHAGKGDVYGASLWIGQAPTYTPLHRDPNPNVFVQLAGRKRVRIFGPQVGRGIFAKVQEQIGGTASATMRGEEMMQGEEKQALEKEVWQSEEAHIGQCFEAELDSGDGLFIPKGHWHSVKGVGDGMIGSVNWWFR